MKRKCWLGGGRVVLIYFPLCIWAFSGSKRRALAVWHFSSVSFSRSSSEYLKPPIILIHQMCAERAEEEKARQFRLLRAREFSWPVRKLNFQNCCQHNITTAARMGIHMTQNNTIDAGLSHAPEYSLKIIVLYTCCCVSHNFRRLFSIGVFELISGKSYNNR